MSTIFKCELLHVGACHGKGWHVQVHHRPTGIPYSEELCPLYPTRRDALEAVREAAREA